MTRTTRAEQRSTTGVQIGTNKKAWLSTLTTTMFEPTRGGTRGGQAEFKWTDVSADKDREHYLGHSINAPTGRWQKNKDIHWYNREKEQTEAERQEEIRKIKELEAEALAGVLGYEPTKPKSDGPTTSANSIPVAVNPERAAAEKAAAKEEKRRLKAERKEEKRRRKEEKRARRKERGHSRGHSHRGRDSDESDEESEDEYERRKRRHRTRSRSPVRRPASPPRPPPRSPDSDRRRVYDERDRRRELEERYGRSRDHEGGVHRQHSPERYGDRHSAYDYPPRRPY